MSGTAGPCVSSDSDMKLENCELMAQERDGYHRSTESDVEVIAGEAGRHCLTSESDWGSEDCGVMTGNSWSPSSALCVRRRVEKEMVQGSAGRHRAFWHFGLSLVVGSHRQVRRQPEKQGVKVGRKQSTEMYVVHQKY